MSGLIEWSILAVKYMQAVLFMWNQVKHELLSQSDISLIAAVSLYLTYVKITVSVYI